MLLPQSSYATPQAFSARRMPRISRVQAVLSLCFVALVNLPLHSQQPPLLDTMTGELQRAYTTLGRPTPNQKDADKVLPPYFISYSVSDVTSATIRAQYGALADSTSSHVRV